MVQGLLRWLAGDREGGVASLCGAREAAGEVLVADVLPRPRLGPGGRRGPPGFSGTRRARGGLGGGPIAMPPSLLERQEAVREDALP
ncbi:hypothetical protein ABZY36_25180 [Streptomyces sp. NPDC006627]|uniref:hypothetical protein n=1 Tax=Streptomyces sp. NPDC006627 TaxID=3154679 RepID=UPI0033B85F08